MTCVIEKIEEDKVFVSFDKGSKGFVKKSNLAKVKTGTKYIQICCR